jgi:hypothetical protein
MEHVNTKVHQGLDVSLALRQGRDALASSSLGAALVFFFRAWYKQLIIFSGGTALRREVWFG